MSLSIGIVGLPNVGKSTLFNALTKKQAEAKNFPFCTIDPNVGIVKVPDPRLAPLAVLSKSARIVPAAVEFVDIAGLVKGAHQGEGLGNKFLANIRECQAVCEVVRAFADKDIVHVHNRVDPAADVETIETELLMADLETVDRAIARTVREAKSGNKELIRLRDLLEKVKAELDQGRPARAIALDEEEKVLLKPYNLLTQKPVIYILNRNAAAEEAAFKTDSEVVGLNVRQEQEIAGLPEAEQAEYVRELGLEQSGLDRLIQSAYRVLGLETFLTTGPEETRAWTVRAGAKAPEAAGVIHSDFEKGFIRAEVINWQKLLEAGSEAAARDQGLIRTEGKDYVVQDGDVCHFLFN